MQNRRHQDNFIPSQKTVVPLNRYDEAEKIIAKALYTFNGQTTRELSFRKGDIINVRKQIDSNWYEGEVHGRIGLFPYNYVEVNLNFYFLHLDSLLKNTAYLIFLLFFSVNKRWWTDS